MRRLYKSANIQNAAPQVYKAIRDHGAINARRHDPPPLIKPKAVASPLEKLGARETKKGRAKRQEGQKKMKNAKEYKNNLENHIQFGGWDYLTPEEEQELRYELKEEKRRGAVALEGFNNRAVAIPFAGGWKLRSFYTTVAVFYDGAFYKTAEVFSKTTLKHINAFRAMLKLEAVNKCDWINTETSRAIYDFNGKVIQI